MIIAGGLVGAALFGGIPSALADQDPGANPPNCTAADLEGVRAGVSAATSAYLFTHPDVNDFVSSMRGLSRAQVATKMKAYMAANPQVKDDMTGIRQPLVDLKDRCAAPPSP
ncbi:hemophore-related protein [Mycolicibacterium sp. P9-64]|uniref:heme-binding protein n=1 Tax=Mycolicibacterium sp. P9-64 TaxID=2024612 RepID=UPI0011ECEC7A|nr:heme-binding protein [Mycolicibacterium sp. P9-64]KAA0085911.1 hemophore-related protein [Mycolicibacterium sp. P9-64]